MELIEVTGTFYEVGKQLGEKTKISLQVILNDFKGGWLYSRILSYINTPEGRTIYDRFLCTVQTYCINFVQELKGLADGSGVNFDDLFLFNTDHEFVAIFDITPGSSHDVTYASLYDGCTNITIETHDSQTWFGHTEDINPNTVQYGIMVKFKITDDDGNIQEEFVDYYIPGFLSGSKMGYNRHGVVMGNNCILQKGINLKGIPRKFMCRSLCDVQSAEEARKKLESHPGMATSYTFQFVQKTKDREENTVIETTNSETERFVTVFKPTGFYHHCNILQHQSFPCHPEESSVHRAAVISQYLNRGEQWNKQLVQRILSNTQDPNFPVYRTGKSPDYLATASTAIYDVNTGTYEVYTGKPTDSSPNYVFNVPCT